MKGNYMKHPNNIFTLEQSAEFAELVERSIADDEWECLYAWCNTNANRLKRAVAAWTHFEELIKRGCVDELMFYNTPGVFTLRMSQVQGLNGFDLEGVDDGEEWDGRTLDDCITKAALHIMDVEQAERDDV